MFLQGFILGLGLIAAAGAGFIVYLALNIGLSCWLSGIKIKKDVERIGKQILEEAKANGIETKTESSD